MDKRKWSFLIVTVCVIVILSWMFYWSPGSNQSSKENQAVIVDGLINFPNQTFIEEASGILTDAGFDVEVVKPSDVTVEFYRTLPSKGYDLIILRVHCGPLRRESAGGAYIPEGTVFFTTELYTPDKYQGLQSKGLLAVAKIRGDNENRYFAVPPLFFEALDGNFENTTIILDSCYGFWSDAPFIMSGTLRQKGVRMFIGWYGEVQAHHTDSAILALLKRLYIEGLTVSKSIDIVMNEIGPDPFYKSELLYYPLDSGGLVLKK